MCRGAAACQLLALSALAAHLFVFSLARACLLCDDQSVVALARKSADFMAELRSLVAADARVATADIHSIHCGVVELTDRYDVDGLANGDRLVVRLRAHPRATQSAGFSSAAPLSGHKRDADGPAVSDADGGASASKRPKSGSNK